MDKLTVEEIKNWLENTAKMIVGFPEKIRSEQRVDDMGVLLTLKCDPTDAGKVLGKAGATVNAIRTVLKSFGMRAQARISLKVDVPALPGRNREGEGRFE